MHPAQPEHDSLLLAKLSLEGLSVGDAFGEQFFGLPEHVAQRLSSREMPAAPWRFTDDTAMALSVVEVLESHGRIDQEALAQAFARRYMRDPARGYGGGAHQILSEIAAGGSWRRASAAAFSGGGSMGNGAAMRVAPIGAFFWRDPKRVCSEAVCSAEVTHMHREGQAGAVAVALAASWAVTERTSGNDNQSVFEFVLDLMDRGEVRSGVEQARRIDLTLPPAEAAATLGSGQRILAQDTVPYCIWIIARHSQNFTEAMWSTLEGLGDRDTTCAIVGSVVALRVGPNGIMRDWVDAREPLTVL